MISVDYAKLDDVLKFSAFLDVLMNPSQLKQMSEDIKADIEVLKTYVEAKSKVEDVDSYVATKEKEVAIKQQQLSDAQGDLASKSADFNAFMSTKNQEIAARDVASSNALQTATENRQTLEDTLTRLQEKEVEIDNLRSQLEDQKASLIQQAQDMQDKTAKLKSLLGS